MDLDIQIPYTTLPRMKKNIGYIFNKNPDKRYILEKENQLKKYSTQLYAETYEFRNNDLLSKICKNLGVQEKSNIKDFALMFEEDIAIIHNGILVAICFCFPSSWVPEERIGLTLSQIHMPVADNDKLVAASEKISKTISDPTLGSFRRQVWTITNNADLSNHPDSKNLEDPKSINDLYLRTETQITYPLGDCLTSVFFVKVDVIPLIEVWSKIGHSLLLSVNSMSQSIIEYKNLQKIKPIINKVLLM